jgi:hypothetical protein
VSAGTHGLASADQRRRGGSGAPAGATSPLNEVAARRLPGMRPRSSDAAMNDRHLVAMNRTPPVHPRGLIDPARVSVGIAPTGGPCTPLPSSDVTVPGAFLPLVTSHAMAVSVAGE